MKYEIFVPNQLFKGARFFSLVIGKKTILILLGLFCISLFFGFTSVHLQGDEFSSFRATIPSKQLLVTYFRGGSTMLGDLMQTQNNTFYIFEPLKYLKEFVKDENPEVTNQFLLDLFSCKFSFGFLQWLQQNQGVVTLPRDVNYYKSCAGVTAASNLQLFNLPSNHPCFSESFITKYCLKSSIRIIKVTRLHLGQIDDLLNKQSDLKVIHLTRDPRGIMSSRKHPNVYLWCKSIRLCRSEAVLCNSMEKDLVQSCTLGVKYPGRVVTLRFEDISCNPGFVTEKLFEFLGYESVSEVTTQFLKSHTNGLVGNSSGRNPMLQESYDTIRESDKVAFSWRDRLDSSDLLRVEDACVEVIIKLGWPLGSDGVFDCVDLRKTMANDSLYSVFRKC